MINVKELRIGNWICTGKTNYKWQVSPHDIERIDADMYDANPIPLSPELLEKCCFELYKDSEYWKHYRTKKGFYVSLCLFPDNDKNPYGLFHNEWYAGEGYTHIPSLHWLQNYYFFTYGKELEVEL